MGNSNEYMAEYMLRRYHERRAEAFEMLGGVCATCGATEKLEIDHRDPAQKSFSVSKMWSVSRKRYLKEIAKCQLLCGEHHRLKTTLERGLKPARGTHGTLSAARYCNCEKCKGASRDYMREYRRKKHGSVEH